MAYSFIAPTGSPIAGLMQTDSATWGIRDAACPEGFDYLTDGPKADWTSFEVAGSLLYVDEAGETWLQHHLIPDDAPHFAKDVTDAFQREIALGEAWDAAKDATAAVQRAISTVGERSEMAVVLTALVDTVRAAEHAAQRCYTYGKRQSQRLKAGVK